MRISGWLYGIQQCLCACGILIALADCTGVRRPAFPRLVLTALLSGLTATLAAADGSMSVRLAALVLTPLLPRIAWPRIPHALRPRVALATFTLPLIMSGSARLLSSLGLAGVWLVPAVCVIVPLLAHFAPRTNSSACVTVEITRGVNRLSLTALVDSGNLLRDPLTGLPVIVVSQRAVSRLIALPPPGEIAPGMRLISVRTVTGTALMTVFHPSRVRLMQPGGWREASAMIGVAPGGYDGFQALVPAALTQNAHAST